MFRNSSVSHLTHISVNTSVSVPLLPSWVAKSIRIYTDLLMLGNFTNGFIQEFTSTKTSLTTFATRRTLFVRPGRLWHVSVQFAGLQEGQLLCRILFYSTSPDLGPLNCCHVSSWTEGWDVSALPL